ncbi:MULTISPECIES: hypothetical protein [unclassified Actinomyces]|uniref:hypothetical protein n=1 Tax=unclassified Actinomyces TaxID=2609248 RepID=UPI000D597F6C|nr:MULTISPECIES: hypothetical protein [unclassified Actinomyces]RAX21017.1 hypothetical protein DRB07_12425 [Actinomyces sp. Z3]
MSRTDANALVGRVLAEVPPFLLVGLGGLLRVCDGPLWAASLLVLGGVLWQVLVLAKTRAESDTGGVRINNLGRLAVIALLLLLGNWGALTGGLALLALFLGVCVALRCWRFPDGPRPVRRCEFNPLRGV